MEKRRSYEQKAVVMSRRRDLMGHRSADTQKEELLKRFKCLALAVGCSVQRFERGKP